MRKTKKFASMAEYEVWTEKFDNCSDYEEIPSVIEEENRILMDMITYCKSWKIAVRRFRKAFSECGKCVEGWIDCIQESCENGYFEDRNGWKPAWIYDPKEIMEYGRKYGTYAWAVEEIDDGCWYVYLNLSGGWFEKDIA